MARCQNPLGSTLGLKSLEPRNAAFPMAPRGGECPPPNRADPPDAPNSSVVGVRAIASACRVLEDPFAGSAGVLLAAAAHCGAFCLGADTCARVLLGDGAGRDIGANFEQLGLPSPELLLMDANSPAWRADARGSSTEVWKGSVRRSIAEFVERSREGIRGHSHVAGLGGSRCVRPALMGVGSWARSPKEGRPKIGQNRPDLDQHRCNRHFSTP